MTEEIINKIYELENIFKEKGFVTSINRERKTLDIELPFGVAPQTFDPFIAKWSMSFKNVQSLVTSNTNIYNMYAEFILQKIRNRLIIVE